MCNLSKKVYFFSKKACKSTNLWYTYICKVVKSLLERLKEVYKKLHKSKSNPIEEKVMSKKIYRTFTKTIVKASKVDFENEQPIMTPLDLIELDGSVSMERAQREVSSIYEGKQVVIVSLSVNEEQYVITQEDFKKYGTKVEKEIEA